MTKQTLTTGVVVLVLGGLIAKIFGGIYRIPLTWVLGTQGLGIYQLVYPIFSLLLVLSSTTAPTAISTMIAERVGKHQYASIDKIFRLSLISLLTLGILAGISLSLFSTSIASLQGNLSAKWCYVCISIAIPLVSILSTYRGYFQGLLNMTPTAVSQVVEQVGKLVFGLLLAILFRSVSVEFATLGAVAGVVVSEMLAVLFVIIYASIHKNQRYTEINTAQNINNESTKALFKELVRNATPILLCGFVLPVLQVVDSLLVVKLLGNAGIDSVVATKMWGINSGVVNSLINLPVALTLCVAVSVAPNLRNGLGNKQGTLDKITLAHKISINIALPCMVVLSVLASLIIPFLYQHTLGDSILDETNLAINLLVFNTPFILIIALMQVQNASLQGLKLSKVPLINMFVAGVVKLAVMLVLTQNPTFNIYGVALANVLFYIFAFVLNDVYMHTKLGWKMEYRQLLPCVIACAVVALYLWVGTLAFEYMNIYIKLPLLLLIGVSVYFSTLWATGGAEFLLSFVKKFKKRVYDRPRT